MTSELGIFILWDKARHKEKEILSDINDRFDVLQLLEIKWAKNRRNFISHLKRFYNKTWISSLKKTLSCGYGNFIIAVVSDNNPQINENGLNVNIAQAKHQYRQRTGGGFLIHSSDNQEEAYQNSISIMGMNPREILDTYGVIDEYNTEKKPIFLDISN